jgi:hypothetical protein
MHFLTGAQLIVYGRLKTAQGRLEAVEEIQKELEGIQLRGERMTWDILKGVIDQIQKEWSERSVKIAIEALNAAGGWSAGPKDTVTTH